MYLACTQRSGFQIKEVDGLREILPVNTVSECSSFFVTGFARLQVTGVGGGGFYHREGREFQSEARGILAEGDRGVWRGDVHGRTRLAFSRLDFEFL